MSKQDRKTIKITLPADCVNSFHAAKARAEQVAMIKLTDTQYASRLIQWALNRNRADVASVVFTGEEGALVMSTEGHVNTDAYRAAIHAAYLVEIDWEKKE